MNAMPSDLITADMTVLDIVARFRETEAVFRRYDAAAGECLCCNALFETLKQVSERYAIDLNALVHDLNAAIAR
jgi:hypothetical protein